MPNWILSVTVLFAAAGALAVLVPAWRGIRASRPSAARPPAPRRPPKIQETKAPPANAAVTVKCPVCQCETGFSRAELRPLSGAEVALIVAQRKEASRRDLAEAYCPSCEACFTFYVDEKPPALLGTNIFHAHQKGHRCAECREPLLRPTWDSRKFQSRCQAPDALQPRIGLDCTQCGAVCCVACCEEISRNRSTDGTLMCPRCRRKPMEAIHYF